MKGRYRLFLRRKSVYYAFDNSTRKHQSLHTNDPAEAARLVAALNEAGKQSAMNLRLTRVYLEHSDPEFSSRIWQHVLAEMAKTKQYPTLARWDCAMRQEAFDLIRWLPLRVWYLSPPSQSAFSHREACRAENNCACVNGWRTIAGLLVSVVCVVRWNGKLAVRESVMQGIEAWTKTYCWRLESF